MWVFYYDPQFATIALTNCQYMLVLPVLWLVKAMIKLKSGTTKINLSLIHICVGMKKPMIVTDHVLVQLGMTKKIQDILLHSNIESMVFNEVEPNPTDQTVTKGVKNYKTWGCDGLISLGGGSPHDCAKAIGLVISNGGAIKDYEGLPVENA